ncbi:MAG: UDP-N-acetylmuramyl pentapeptide phosphotransferase/UDP-N-acetylglucosamine-1-phosphate transferase [Algoriphagus marincola HL-49]|uniref:UDP-N-acetylmuramyl pentapeptide phosphotransferase/UDP-N-acetylglucosamine-1-phosphate transferase n=1 Tax=Algoriphagus marincola HL-49 TaxID=1305737 RepID=A0A0N8KHE2_9BACT|nr:MAG: UDP-N-acetylmuramyl pentapeptide phosphotransferase/UDP-N-acetylglucosamine-1-phosphate transferase [Algoriphagus marincola HL-49]
MILSYLSIFLFFLLIALVYYRLALRFDIVDRPNSRSSHTKVTVRGGGILIPVAVLLWWMAYDFQNTWMILGMMWIAAISMLDDMFDISRLLRFGIQFLALSFAFWDLNLFSQIDWYLLPVFYFFGLGVINAINFMDGINGITGLYSLVFFGSLLAVNEYLPIFPEQLLSYQILALLVFFIFNLRKRALMFAGDIGSISLAYLMIYLLTKWYLVDHNPIIVLFLLVYGIDVFFTILRRLIKGEKVTEPHRTHLYQYLVNQVKIDHVIIALVYAILQLLINFGLFIYYGEYPNLTIAWAIMIALSLIYLALKKRIREKYHLN